MRRALAAVATAVTLFAVATPVAQATSPVPGRFCKTADIGKKVTTAKYGVVICKKDGDRARWK